MHYETLEVRFERTESDSLEVVVETPFRKETARGTLGLSFAEIERLEKSAGSAGASQIGARLYDALFAGGSPRDLFQRVLGRCVPGETRLRLDLRFHLGSDIQARLGRLPWELLFHDRFLLLAEQPLLLTRSFEVEAASAPAASPPPLRVLVAISSPTDRPPLDTEAEKVRIQRALRNRPEVHARFLEPATLESLEDAVRQWRPQVLHFIGHGTASGDADGSLVLTDGTGLADHVSGVDLVVHLVPRGVRLLVLNACETASIPHRPLAGTAIALIRGGMPAVIAMRQSISDVAAIRFGDVFHERLAAGEPVDAALSDARIALSALENHPIEWSIPVLFLRSLDDRSILTAGRREETKAPLPAWVGRFAAWRPFGVPVGAGALQIGGALGSLLAGVWCSLVALIAAGRATSQPFGLFLLLTFLSGALATCAVWSARRWPTLRAFWLSLSVLGLILPFLL
ncbi:MAG TPA: CHAT domain-containing protein [Thermoanaerobaculia bacterium]|nr:CHAT domain-containing protein [Thermoanaerobaculia bacterium]